MAARSLLLNALAQSDVDMNFHKLLNLDTSNLAISGLPPDVIPPAHNFLNGWIRATQTWSFAQPAFSDLSGNLTVAQQQAIVHLGTVIDGTWSASVIDPRFLPTLDLILKPVGNVDMGLTRLIHLADPVDDQDAVTKAFLNFIAPGLKPHAAVAAATNTDSLLVGLLIMDGYTPVAGDRILVKNQSTTRHWQNGVYIASASAWTRATDFNNGTTQFAQAYVLVLNGATNGGTGWVQITPSPVDITGPDIGTEPVFVQFTPRASTVSAGPGLQKIGNVISAVGTPNRIAIGTGIDIDPAYVGQASITTLGAITTGIWMGGIIGSGFGGTGANNGASTINIAANLMVSLEALAVGASLELRIGSGFTLLHLPGAGTLATLAGVETFTNKSIDAGQITGTLALARGGTGAGSQPAAANNILPAQGPATIGKVLKSDGTNVLWG